MIVLCVDQMVTANEDFQNTVLEQVIHSPSPPPPQKSGGNFFFTQSI